MKLRWNSWGNTGHHFSHMKLAKASTAANTAVLTVGASPFPCLGRPFPCLCHSFHCASMRVCTAEQWLRVGNWSNWKLIFFSFFFFPGYVTSTLSQIWFTVWPQENLFQQKESLSKKKETSTTTLEVLDFINWKWSYEAVEVKTTPSYKTNLLYGVRLVAPSLSFQFQSI